MKRNPYKTLIFPSDLEKVSFSYIFYLFIYLFIFFFFFNVQLVLPSTHIHIFNELKKIPKSI